MQIYNKTTLNVPAEILEVIPVPANISGNRKMLLYFNIYKNRNIHIMKMSIKDCLNLYGD